MLDPRQFRKRNPWALRTKVGRAAGLGRNRVKKLTAIDSQTHSADVIAENVGHLRALFPEAFTEGKVNFEVLKRLLGVATDNPEEKYGLN